MTLDIARLRRDTPACETRLHFNNAGAALMPNAVSDVLHAHLDLERRIGGYEAEAAAAAELADFAPAFAQLLHCSADEIAWVENATRAWDLAVHALPLTRGDRVLVHESDYASNHLALAQLALRRELYIDTIPSASDGTVDVDALERCIDSRTRAVFITHSPTHDGLINPAVEIGAVARRHGLWYVLDGCQSVGQIDIDVRAIGCHVYTGSGRKFLRGPRGTGFLYVDGSRLAEMEPPFIDLHAGVVTEDGYRFADGMRRFECWESYVAGRLGERAAVRYLLEVGVEAVTARIAELASALRAALKDTGRITVLDHGTRRGGIVTFVLHGEAPEMTMPRLRARGINTSVAGPYGAPRAPQWKEHRSAVRASVHAYNTTEEIERFVRALCGADA
jgi:selenocysteine lyase/cysteine desulfurase